MRVVIKCAEESAGVKLFGLLVEEARQVTFSTRERLNCARSLFLGRNFG